MLTQAKSNGSRHADVAIVGAGPTGAAAAIAFALRGARVALLEGHPEASRRFAGEWIHPPGVRTLHALGVDTRALATHEGHGFAIFGDDAEDPVCLPYDGGVGIARVHEELVNHLREHALGHDRVQYLPHHVFSGVEGNTLQAFDRARGSSVTLRAGRIIGADGRASKVRAAIGGPTASQQLSYMAGLELKDAPLPFEGLGHVFLGGPGPALVYRIDERRVRACLDIPSWCASGARKSDAVFEAFRTVLPRQLEPALRAAVLEPLAWAQTGIRRRAFFGLGDVWLAGDAVGHVHPLSGVGITLGLMDAEAAARSRNLTDYRRERSAHVAELLANVLYQAFARTDASAVRIRHGLLRMLRKSSGERRRTMRLLTGDDRDGTSFADSFLRATGQVVLTGAGRSVARRQSWSEWARQLRKDAEWLEWPLRAWPAADTLLQRGNLEKSRKGFRGGLARTFTDRSALS
jgi:2-polyprenyl-6-methoxyphenol hydroxylase-like FAD-dependent oxidoreductase